MSQAEAQPDADSHDAVPLDAHDLALVPCSGSPLADLCDHDPWDLDRDPRLRAGAPAPPAAPCGPLCTPWCLAQHR